MNFKILFTFFSLFLVFLETGLSKPNFDLCDKKNVIAHHIGLNDWPENTLFAVKQAKKAGLQWINITVMLSVDDIPFLFHGFDLGKTTEDKGNPEDYTIEYLQKLNASFQFKKEGRYIYRDRKTADFNIPTLKAVLSESGNLFVVLDIKAKRYKNLIDQLEGVLTAQDWKRVIFYSTDAKVLDYLLQRYPNAISFQKMDSAKLVMIGVNDLEAYEKARKSGVDAVYTDIPLEIIQHRGCIDKTTSLTLT